MSQPATEMSPRERICQTATDLGLGMVVEFVPFSQSRNKHEKSPSLNWRVSLYKSGKLFLTTDYSAGCGHAPSYKQNDNSKARDILVRNECETGHNAQGFRKAIKPDLADVLYSLVSDSDVIDCGSFEEWAGNYGYEVDSRKAESTYRQCLEIALKLRNAIGEDGLQRLREVCQDY